jgi:hypothetical protein
MRAADPLEQFRQGIALSVCFSAILGANPLRTFAEIALDGEATRRQ